MNRKKNPHKQNSTHIDTQQGEKILSDLFRCAQIVLLFIPLNCSLSLAADDIDDLSLYYGKDALVVSPSRSPKPISQTAENVIVITAQEIEEMNAHTLEEVLNLATGVAMETVFRNVGKTFIEGSQMFHVKMMMDGVTLNDLSTNTSTAALIPVQSIERIEIIKGPASSAWGSSMGGIINIITKDPGSSPLTGVLSTSYGNSATRDFRAEASGTTGGFGWYAQGTQHASDGFFPGEQFDKDHFSVKLANAASDRLNVSFAAAYAREKFGTGQNALDDIKMNADIEALYAALSINYQFNAATEMSLALRTKKLEEFLGDRQLSDGAELNSITEHDWTNGATLMVSSRRDAHNFVLGSEFEREKFEDDSRYPPLSLAYSVHQKREKWAVFGNDTVSVGKFTVTPGIRFDRISDNQDFTSPSLGITYSLSSSTLLRAYAAKGFNTPGFAFQYGETMQIAPNPDIRNEKIKSVQAGVESTAVPYVWLKASLFRHTIWDALAIEVLPDELIKIVNAAQELLQGLELEARTSPMYNTSVGASAALIRAKDPQAGKIPLRPAAIYTVEAKYKVRKSFLAMLTGHYTRWNPSPDDPQERDPNHKNTFIWDFHTAKTIWSREQRNAEIFLSVHNLLNDKQNKKPVSFSVESLRIPDRWTEAGIRFTF